MEFGVGLGWRDVCDGVRQAAGRDPVDPFEGGVFDGVEAVPGVAAADDLGAAKAGDRLGQGVVIGVAAALQLWQQAAVRKQIVFALREHADPKPAMFQDIEAGRRTGIEALNGHVERAGTQHGINVTFNWVPAALVRMRGSHI